MKIFIKDVSVKGMQYKAKQRPRYCRSCKKQMAEESIMCVKCWEGGGSAAK